MAKNPKSKRGDAERAAEWYVHEVLKCVESCRSVKTQWQRQDMFGCDVIGIRKDGSLCFIQATAGQHSAVTARRRKLERNYRTCDTVQVIRLVSNQDPANARRKLWFFRVHEYIGDDYDGPHDRRHWETQDKAIPVPKEWFKSYKNANKGE